MKQRAAREPVHALVLPLAEVALLIPSALVAEVVNVPRINSVPLSPPWVIGAVNWRSRPVPVVSFETLSGEALSAPGPRSKIVVFYPLQGRRAWEFFGLVASGEPQPRTFHDPEALSARVENNNPYLAMTLRLDQSVVGIPDLAAIKKAFYPAG